MEKPVLTSRRKGTHDTMDDDKKPALDSGTAQARFTSLISDRSSYLTRAYDCAELTIPSILPRQGHTGATPLVTPWQSVGARCVNNLSSKLLVTALPSNQSFFRLRIDEILVKEMMGTETGKNMKTDLDSGLGVVEKAVTTEIEVSGDRVTVFEAFKHLLVTGNILLHDSNDGLRAYHLNNYVVRRDPSGNALEMIAFERIDPDVLPAGIREPVEAEVEATTSGAGVHAPVDLYTRVQRTDNGWDITQEVCGKIIPQTIGTYPLDKCPWIPLRFTKIDGENYGRSYVEEYLGDFRTCEDLSQALAEGAKAAAKLLLLVKPNGTTRLKTIQDAKNGDISSGNAEDVTVVQASKFADFQTAEKRLEVIEQRLEMAFLLNTSVQRNGDRVTAEEIRFMAQELEAVLGGFYTILAKEFQLPYVKSKMARMQKMHRLPALPKGIVRPSIVTGMDALGRSVDGQNLKGFFVDMMEAFGAEVTAQYINVAEGAKRLATARSIDTDGLVNTQDAVQEQQQQAQQREMAAKLGPQAISAGGKLAGEVMKHGQGTGNSGGN